MSDHGLPDATLLTLEDVLAACPRVEKAILYGSRAKGNFRPGSDIDLTLLGSALTFDDLARIAGALEESSIPYQVDLSLWDQLTDEALREHVERVGVPLYVRHREGQNTATR